MNEKMLSEKRNEKYAKMESILNCAKEEERPVTEEEAQEFEQLEIDIEKLEERKTALETLMSGTDYEKIAEYTKEYQDVSNSLEEKYLRWEELA